MDIFEELLNEKAALKDLTGEPDEAGDTSHQSYSLGHLFASGDSYLHHPQAGLMEIWRKDGILKLKGEAMKSR